jgi:hypothetical protein
MRAFLKTIVRFLSIQGTDDTAMGFLLEKHFNFFVLFVFFWHGHGREQWI